MEQNIKRLTCDLCGKSVDINNNYNKGFQKIQLPCEMITCFEGETHVRHTFRDCDVCSNCSTKLWYMFRNEVAEISYDTKNKTTKIHLKCDIASE